MAYYVVFSGVPITSCIISSFLFSSSVSGVVILLRCFGKDTKGADGAADLLEVLRNSPLKKLNFRSCSQIPSTAWQRVPCGAWPALRDAPGIPEEELHRIRGGHV